MADFDRAVMNATGFHKPEDLDKRRKELRAKISNDPDVPATPQFTREEMVDAAQRMVASLRGKLVS